MDKGSGHQIGTGAMSLETKTSTNVKQAVPFFRVSNIEESVRYYVEGLGFEITKKWIARKDMSPGSPA
jgi:hypothetical protein